MVYILGTRKHLYTILWLLAATGGRLATVVRPVSYERLLGRMTKDFWWKMAKDSYGDLRRHAWSPRQREVRLAVGPFAYHLARYFGARRRLPRGTYVFTDLERLSTEFTRRATFVWNALADSDTGDCLLNHPAGSMRRYELLRNLYECDINAFNVYRVTEGRWPERYPVFLRHEDDHDGPITPLLRSRRELEDAIEGFTRHDHRRDRLLIVEFCDTADARGIYRKYGAFIIGNQVFPKSVQFSRHWVQKRSDLKDSELLREELEYVEENPHEKILREIFALAKIEYGRMDYAILNDRVQVWEINTNPTLVTPRVRPNHRAAVASLAVNRVTAAFEALCRPDALS